MYLNFDDIRLSGFSESDYEVLITLFPKQRKEVIYLFDEIQLAPVWERFLRRMHDNGASIVLLDQTVLSSAM
ncbi:MAG: AAA family ATPase, partial [Candidatus Sabulitectum sp.]|nr:AAA family ATPase [Candidatus Sabulitectum sp.]